MTAQVAQQPQSEPLNLLEFGLALREASVRIATPCEDTGPQRRHPSQTFNRFHYVKLFEPKMERRTLVTRKPMNIMFQENGSSSTHRE